MTKKAKVTADLELLQNAALFSLSLRSWGNRRTIKKGGYTTDAADDLTNATKKLVKSPEYDDIITCMNNCKAWVLQRVMPSNLQEGLYFISTKPRPERDDKLSVAEEVTAVIVETNRIIKEELVPKFVAKFAERVEAAKRPRAEGGLGSLFDAADYPAPDTLAERFGIQHYFVSFGIPDNLPKQIKAEEAAKLRAKCLAAQDEVVAALRAGVREMIAHLLSILDTKPGQKPKRVHDSLVLKWRTLFETFAARNLMDDAELAGLVAQAEAIMTGIKPDDLKGDGSLLRNTVVAQFKEMQPAINKLVSERPTRKFTF